MSETVPNLLVHLADWTMLYDLILCNNITLCKAMKSICWVKIMSKGPSLCDGGDGCYLLISKDGLLSSYI